MIQTIILTLVLLLTALPTHAEIFQGTVEVQKEVSYWREGRIYTYYTLEWKSGHGPAGVEIPGGQVGNQGMLVPHKPRLSAGKSYFVELEPKTIYPLLTATPL